MPLLENRNSYFIDSHNTLSANENLFTDSLKLSFLLIQNRRLKVIGQFSIFVLFCSDKLRQISIQYLQDMFQNFPFNKNQDHH